MDDCPMDDSEEEGDTEVGASHFGIDETILIFDWDDTVLPSSWVQEKGLKLDRESQPTQKQQEDLAELARLASETLRLAKQMGTVLLVTNAERGWIELSCQKFMPELLPSLENVKLLSARSAYEPSYGSSPLEWKLRAFESEIGRIFAAGEESDARRKNVVSIGDSAHEREALIRVTAGIPNCRTKSLKFVERPGVEQLCKQHALVARCFSRIVHHDGNLDLHIRAV
jgi:hypothetical protein